MSLDTQVALARPPRGESSHLSRAARQVVPPFLQKLYEIVNDPANEELIKWSENGDSFYVLNHEKFAREVLGRWFKHQKFASFVRQLNMYGFHKIPHLQQGVLKSDTDTEPWHFEHPNFHRGQPDLLCLIQRKKQPTHGQAEDATIEMHDPTQAPTPLTNVTPGHLMDINSIVNGVSAIKRHQQAISSDLSALKQSNDALWKEAVAARQRHAKHQDTINRILKFLAGVFGHTDGSPHSPDGSHTPPQVTPRIRQRLMIGDGRSPTKGKHVDIMEVEDDEGDILRNNNARTSFSADQYAKIETPDTSVSSPSVLESIASSETPFSPVTEITPDRIKSPPILPSQVLSRSNTSTPVPRLTNGSTNSATSAPSSLPPNNDAMWQAAIQHMINSPGQLQRIMQAFATQQSLPSLNPSTTDPIPQNPNSSTITAYDPPEYARWLPPPASSASSVSAPLLAPAHADETQPLHLLLDESGRLQKTYRDAAEIDADMDMLQTSINSLIQNLGIDPTTIVPQAEDPVSPSVPTANGANGVDGVNGMNGLHNMNGVNGMNGASGMNGMNSINGINGMNGMGPSTNGFAAPLAHEAFTNVLHGLDGDASHPDYLLDSLLSQIVDGSAVPGAAGVFGSGVGVGGGVAGAMNGGMNGGMNGSGEMDYPDITDHYDHSARIDGTAIEDASTEQLTAFLDEAATNADAGASPKGGGVTKSPKATTHQKRKSDAIDLPLPTQPEDGSGKKVRRKR